jgi:hypothetical protein
MKISLFLSLVALSAPSAFAAPTQGAPEAAPHVADPMQPLLQLSTGLAAKAQKANPSLEQFREDLPLSSGKNEAVLDQLPLAPNDE